jgi:hypothetical protein
MLRVGTEQARAFSGRGVEGLTEEDDTEYDFFEER